jgi:integrase
MKTLEVLDKYLSGKNLAKNSIMAYRQYFRTLNEFTPEFPTQSGIINEWIHWLSTNKHLADTSIKHYYTAVQAIARYMTKNYDLVNPFLKCDPPTVLHKQRRIFTPAQIAIAITACKTDEHRALMLGLIDSTCRIEDLAGLYGRDINTNSFKTTHGKEGGHTYRLDPHLCTIFKQLAGDDNSPVFKSKTDPSQPATAGALGKRINRILLKAGFTGAKLGPHTFRHSSGSLIAKATKSALSVKAILGHSDIATSMGYIHEIETELAQETSPLKLVAEQIFKDNPNNPNIRQTAMLTAGQSTEIVATNPPNPTDTLLQTSYAIVPEGTHIRPLLKYEDIQLIRRAFIALSQYGEILTDGSATRDLYHRLTRKAPTIQQD